MPSSIQLRLADHLSGLRNTDGRQQAQRQASGPQTRQATLKIYIKHIFICEANQYPHLCVCVSVCSQFCKKFYDFV